MTIETALVVSIFVLMLTGIIDYASYLHARSRLQWSVSQAARHAVTGNLDTDEDGNVLNWNGTIRHSLRKKSGIYLPAKQISITSVDDSGTLSDGPGRPGDVVIIQVTHGTKPLTPGIKALFPNGKMPIRVTTRFKTESFTDSATHIAGAADDDEEKERLRAKKVKERKERRKKRRRERRALRLGDSS